MMGGYPERDGAAAAAVGLGQEFYGVGIAREKHLKTHIFKQAQL